MRNDEQKNFFFKQALRAKCGLGKVMDETDYVKKNKLMCAVSQVSKFDLLDLILHFYNNNNL